MMRGDVENDDDDDLLPCYTVSFPNSEQKQGRGGGCGKRQIEREGCLSPATCDNDQIVGWTNVLRASGVEWRNVYYTHKHTTTTTTLLLQPPRTTYNTITPSFYKALGMRMMMMI